MSDTTTIETTLTEEAAASAVRFARSRSATASKGIRRVGSVALVGFELCVVRVWQSEGGGLLHLSPPVARGWRSRFTAGRASGAFSSTLA
jgi:hypothetical protein